MPNKIEELTGWSAAYWHGTVEGWRRDLDRWAEALESAQRGVEICRARLGQFEELIKSLENADATDQRTN